MFRIIEENMNEHQTIHSWIGLFESLLEVCAKQDGWLRAVQPAPAKSILWEEWQSGRQWLAIPSTNTFPYFVPREWFERMGLLDPGSYDTQHQIRLTDLQEQQIQRWIRVAHFTENFLSLSLDRQCVNHPKHGPGCVLGELHVIHDQLGPAALYVSLHTSWNEVRYFELGDGCTEELFHNPNWLREWLFQTDWDFQQL